MLSIIFNRGSKDIEDANYVFNPDTYFKYNYEETQTESPLPAGRGDFGNKDSYGLSEVTYKQPEEIRSHHGEYKESPEEALAADCHDDEQYQQEKPGAMEEAVQPFAGGWDMFQPCFQFFRIRQGTVYCCTETVEDAFRLIFQVVNSEKGIHAFFYDGKIQLVFFGVLQERFLKFFRIHYHGIRFKRKTF